MAAALSWGCAAVVSVRVLSVSCCLLSVEAEVSRRLVSRRASVVSRRGSVARVVLAAAVVLAAVVLATVVLAAVVASAVVSLAAVSAAAPLSSPGIVSEAALLSSAAEVSAAVRLSGSGSDVRGVSKLPSSRISDLRSNMTRTSCMVSKSATGTKVPLRVSLSGSVFRSPA